MVDVAFDAFNLVEKPAIILCNPNQVQLYSLGNSTNTKLSLKYNTLSTFNFELTQTLQDMNGNDVTDPAYAFLKAKRLVLIENFGYYQIATVTEDREGSVPIKTVECTSWESELIYRQINGFTGQSIKLYDPVDNTDTFIGRILQNTNWGIGDVTSDLWNIFRDFDVSSNNVYNLLMTTAETAYNCIFTFDTDTRLVNITSIDNATSDTDIFLSFENLIKKTTFKEISDEIVTAMDVYGGDGLDIRSVNPLGTNTIYNFSYYQQRDLDDNLLWISSELNDALDNWYTSIAENMDLYSSYLVQLKDLNGDLLTYTGELADLNSEMAALVETKKVKVEGNLSLTAINIDIDNKQTEIDDKQDQINTANIQIDSVTTLIVGINDSLALTNEDNFSLAEQAELAPYIIQNVYQNTNIIITDIMSNVEIQDQATELYNQATDVLGRASQPRYEFTVEAANFVALKEYSVFTNQLNLGSNVTIENEDGLYIVTAVLEINFSFDRLDDFSIVFSNRLRLDNGNFVQSDLFGSVVKAGTTVNFNSGAWFEYSNDKSEVLYTSSILNTANNELINSSNQEITINEHGLVGRKKLDNGNFSGNQIWLTNNVLSFSNDGFQTSGLALGQITTPSGSTAFGLVASAIFGELLAGSQLRIRNAANNFVLDAGGARLTDATFTITQSAAHAQSIILSPTNGISIINKAGQTIFSADGAGNLTLKAALNAATGSFSGNVGMLSGTIGTATQGLIVDASGMRTLDGQFYILGNGQLHWGGLTLSGSIATFDGTIRADKLIGFIDVQNRVQDNAIKSGKIESLVADKISVGTLNGVNLFGGTIAWGGTFVNPGVVMFGIDGDYRIDAVNTIYLDVKSGSGQGATWGGSAFVSGKNDIYMAAFKKDDPTQIASVVQLLDTTVFINGTTLFMPTLGKIQVAGGTGVNGNYPVNTSNGVKVFTFSRGILVSVI